MFQMNQRAILAMNGALSCWTSCTAIAVYWVGTGLVCRFMLEAGSTLSALLEASSTICVVVARRQLAQVLARDVPPVIS